MDGELAKHIDEIWQEKHFLLEAGKLNCIQSQKSNHWTALHDGPAS